VGRKGLKHAHTNARESVLQDTVQQGKRPYKTLAVYKGRRAEILLAQPKDCSDSRRTACLKAGCRGITAGLPYTPGRVSWFCGHTASPCDFLARFFAVLPQKMRANDYDFYFGTCSYAFLCAPGVFCGLSSSLVRQNWIELNF
jgi:hypothetical protein